MYLITVILQHTQQLLQFHFKQFKDADKVIKKMSIKNESWETGALDIEDDYGSIGCIAKAAIAGVFLTDLSLEMEAHEIVDMAKLRKDLRVQKKRMEDPALRIMVPHQGAV